MQMATEIANDGVSDFDDSEEDQAFTELPARDDLRVEEVQGAWNPKNWYPEDVTLEVWGGNPKDKASFSKCIEGKSDQLSCGDGKQ
jgi:hypothetical protein